MSDIPKKLVADLATGFQRYVDLTPEEIAQNEQESQAAAVRRQEEQAQAEALATLKASAKSKLVAGQPLTEEEAAVLVI
jgi:hypothetical protein